MNIVYIGSSGPLSTIPLQTLINSKFNISAVAVDSNKNDTIPNINKNSDSLASLAFYNNVPLIKLTKKVASNVAAIKKYQPDIILVSCYARKISTEITQLAKTGCFNVHPSLLPRYRGPTPLFWQFKKGEEKFGVTLHRVTEKFDQGNIIAQQTIKMPDGISKAEASILLAKLASKIILKTLPLLQNGNFKEVTQDETIASYQSYFKKEDYAVSVNWTAKRLYNFIAAHKRTMITFPCEIDGEIYELIDVVSYQENAYKELNKNMYCITDNLISFECDKGYIQCVLKMI